MGEEVERYAVGKKMKVHCSWDSGIIVAWERVKVDLKESENRMKLEGGLTSKQLRANMGV